MSAVFDEAIAFLDFWEGAFSDHKQDPGGATIYGISSRYWPSDFNLVMGLFRQGRFIEAKAEAKDFYRREFWKPTRCDDLPREIVLCLFDMAVNPGVKPAILMLQQVAKVKQDGIIGPKTIAAATAWDPRRELCRNLLAERQVYYLQRVKETPEKETFFRGWMRRTIDLAIQIDLPVMRQDARP